MKGEFLRTVSNIDGFLRLEDVGIASLLVNGPSFRRETPLIRFYRMTNLL